MEESATITNAGKGFQLLDRASVGQIRNREISKADGYLVVTMRQYPRFLPKGLIDEYVQALSPQPDLFKPYREFKSKLSDQNQSFQLAEYEQVFALSDVGKNELARLAEVSRQKNVYLVCQCEKQEYCHVDLMLLIAEHDFGANIGKLPFEYGEFRKRLSAVEPGSRPER